MNEIQKLIEYANIAGFPLSPNGNNLTVKNGSNLPHQLKRLLMIYKNDILQVLNKVVKTNEIR